jgi:cephalosporin hydroxylase
MRGLKHRTDGFIHDRLRATQKKRFDRFQVTYALDLPFSEAVAAFPDPNQLYAYTHHYFHHLCPKIIQEHREYFSIDQRGFGEDAFHAMWWLIMREFRPQRCLEIGVYRGQVISLWSLIAKSLGYSCEVHGISPFSAANDSVSIYRNDLDYLGDVLHNFEYFDLPRPQLIKAFSTDPQAVQQVQSAVWDMIYIDGCHDFDVVLADYELCRPQLSHNGIMVLDDSSLGTNFEPPLFASAGHPGPSRVVGEYAMSALLFLGAVGHNNIFRQNNHK